MLFSVYKVGRCRNTSIKQAQLPSTLYLVTRKQKMQEIYYEEKISNLQHSLLQTDAVALRRDG